MEKEILESKRIAIIGYGNMGKAIARSLLNNKTIKSANLITSNSQADTPVAVRKSQVIILCIKPQIMSHVLEEIKNIELKNKLIISIAAGVSINTIEKFLGNSTKIIRVMPNLCTRVGESMSCWIKNKQVTTYDTRLIKSILISFGKEIEMKSEEDLNRVTAVSGSGPAYFFYFIEAFIEASSTLGLGKETSKQLVMQTFKGALYTILQSQTEVKKLREQVTSKGGTTESAINTLMEHKFKEIFYKAIHAAHIRSIELSNY